MQIFIDVGMERANCGNNSNQHTRQQGKAEGVGKDLPIDTEIEPYGKIHMQAYRFQQAAGPYTQKNSAESTESRKDETFCDRLANQPSTARTEGSPDSKFPLPAD